MKYIILWEKTKPFQESQCWHEIEEFDSDGAALEYVKSISVDLPDYKIRANFMYRISDTTNLIK